MKVILLSGGSGTRLWPLSNDSRAKQFLKVLRNTETGQLESMVQRVYRQLCEIMSEKDIIVTTNSAQVDILRNQLGDIPIVVETERRDTFPAIALACTYLYSELGIEKKEIVAIVSVDTFVDNSFYQQVNELENLLTCTGAEIALLGIKPTYPSSKYGYIIPEKHDDYMQVAYFVEKPSEEKAEILIEAGAYWNSGIFVFPLQLIYDTLQANQLPCTFEKLRSNFSSLPKKSFDYAVLEQLSRIVALTYDGYWKDLGTWNTLTEEMSQQIIGNGGISEDCHNTHIINELELPVKVLGVSNAVIAVSADGILVTDKPSSSKMKDMLHEGLFSRPMYQEQQWGWYRVLDYAKKAEKEILTRKLFLKAGRHIEYPSTPSCTFVWTIISGEAAFLQDEKHEILKTGDVIHVSAQNLYVLHAVKDTEFIEVRIDEQAVKSVDWED
ncbi:sugar phosphate nucleotidyltransferase [Saccharibacillus sacchari]|uniref:sugar phosphate nucleotidyltransferase n=1 Tax=Saccharibacillus sacchari TaxID=456493 RepID=UPI00055DCDE7|nr:sugar phosphate nucleotidyltransferase [Saccharibacillus sacchari]